MPENSLAAFEAALALGAGIECDLRLDGDGNPIVFHDPDALRLCGTPARIAATPSAAIAALRLLGTAEAPPTLDQLLALVAGRVPLLLELKVDRNNAPALAAAVARRLDSYDGPVGVMSFAAGIGQWLAAHAPHLSRGLVLGDRDSLLRRSAMMSRAQPHFLAVKVAALHRPWVQQARIALPVYSWTVRTPADREKVARFADAAIWEADGRP